MISDQSWFRFSHATSRFHVQDLFAPLSLHASISTPTFFLTPLLPHPRWEGPNGFVDRGPGTVRLLSTMMTFSPSLSPSDKAVDARFRFPSAVVCRAGDDGANYDPRSRAEGPSPPCRPVVWPGPRGRIDAYDARRTRRAATAAIRWQG